jgi:hypothetical protein
VRERDKLKLDEGKRARLRGEDISRCPYGEGRYSGGDAWRAGFNQANEVLRRGRTCLDCGRDMPPRPGGAELLVRANVLCGECVLKDDEPFHEVRRLPGCGCYLSEPRYVHPGVTYGCSIHDDLEAYDVGIGGSDG